MEAKIIMNGTIADMKEVDQMLCNETKNDGCRFIDFLRGATHFLELAKLIATEYDEKMEKKLEEYMFSISLFGIRSSYELNDDENDLTEAWVRNNRWEVSLRQIRDGMWERVITRIDHRDYVSVEETISVIRFNRYDDAGNDNLRFNGIDLCE